MGINDLHEPGPRPAGYAALIQRLDLQVIPNWHESAVALNRTHRIDSTGEIVRETYISSYWPGDGLGDHLEFALKYDGVNLAILASIFNAVEASKITAYVQSKPTGKYTRRIWYLYELITGERLPLDDLKHGNYVDILDPKAYLTISSGRQIRRQRINDNLLGDGRFCPTVRRTKTIRRFMEIDLKDRCGQILAGYPPTLLKRALSYLYTRETKSSFEIEHIKPSENRTERFIALLQLAEKEDFCNKAHLVDLQNRIVDPRFASIDYRTDQNYVGETVSLQTQRVHFACPKPEDLPDLMSGLIAAYQKMDQAALHPVVHAAIVAYGFVFLHPFEDGNGRIHRFLIHNILARRNFTPESLMFPVSAAMLKNTGDYDASLEGFSKPLLPLVDYSLDDEGRMTVNNDTAVWYRFIDMTVQTEAMFAFIEKTIDTELVEELSFLANYDRAKSSIQNIVDMPDRQIDLFIRFCLQNRGKLSDRKQSSHFDFLTDDETEKMEQAVQSAYGQAP